MYYTYRLKSLKYPNQQYIGSTTDLKRRLVEHNSGKSSHTSKYTPWTVDFYCAFTSDEKRINAFAHRSYLEHDAPVFLAIYDNRVEITSPGGLPRGQTADRALAGYSKIRNVVLAKALNYMRYIEEWGSGLRRVNRVLAEYGIRPVAIDEAAFATQMNVYRIGAPDHEGNEGNHDPNEPNRAPNGTNGDTNSGTNGTNQIVECLRETPSISLDELAKRIGVSRRTVVRMVDRLKKQGRIRRKGGTRGVWEAL